MRKAGWRIMGLMRARRNMVWRVAAGLSCALVIGVGNERSMAGGGQVQLPTTLEDFFEPGTQPNMLTDQLEPPINCGICHQVSNDGNPDMQVAPFDNWYLSMMAQSARDPVWHAALDIANQDAAFAGDTCIRCHSPNAWLNGRSEPTDASAFVDEDLDGIFCEVCHRLTDPIAAPENPKEDGPILAALMKDGTLPMEPGSARYIIDPVDERRGPLDDVPINLHGYPILVSPYHLDAALCGTCHDVSNPVYSKQKDGTYALNAFDAPHPTGQNSQMMPEQRTYGEWLNSQFSTPAGVAYADHRFGGDTPDGVVHSCQECHMPKRYGGNCIYWQFPPFFARPDIPEHSFLGANTWVLGAVYDMYADLGYGLDEDQVQYNIARTKAMLQAASDMSLTQVGNQLKVRIVNQSGHKLPTGYPEGRRMWINVKFYDAFNSLIAERGEYDLNSADLNVNDTKVYEARAGIDSATANASGLTTGHTFHLVLNNVQLKDNRIPPRGFTNAAYDAIGAGYPVPTYADGQYWDDTMYAIPRGAAHAVVTLKYQTSSKEYMEFLRDTNTTTMNGQVAYDAWVNRGMSEPADMDLAEIDLGNFNIADINHDGHVNIDDLTAIILSWGACPAPPAMCSADIDGNGVVNIDDLTSVILNWGH